MIKMKILLLLLLLLTACPCSHSSAAHYPTGKNRPCCLHVSRKNLSRQVSRLVFHKQPARFPCVNAVIFYTKKGPVCVHPNDSWVQQVIANITKKD
ncbi:chemokine (C-C motif) ligand 34b, duplicate 4 [Poecilia formosa]|uniref:chemokine (C-C motif) ligand 34b, duplicate 4 n=1 Tax=Poecilia formosa TaxID=48698 RepID=UPI0004442D6B|nr:PREDICTED: C-C motif chemokine 4-like [Poecilia formosa]